jgi:hypothetical protein
VSTQNPSVSPVTPALTNGSGAAAILAAGIGSFTLAVLDIAGDKSTYVKSSLIFYKPTGPLSGVVIATVVVWLLTWILLELRWKKRTVALGRISTISLVLLATSLLLTFPPIVDLF